MSHPRRLIPLAGAGGGCGAKASRLAAALRAGFPVLPGWVVPTAEGRPALGRGAAAIRAEGIAAGRRAILGRPLGPDLAGELRAAVTELGGRVIVRSSSPLESDPRWSGAFSSVAEVGPDDIAAAVRSCWASAFAVDPLRRLEACGLPPEAAELAVLIQPEISPAAGGTARVTERRGGGTEVFVEAVLGHPGALLAGRAEGVRAHFPGQAPHSRGANALAALIGGQPAETVARLACRIHQDLGDNTIEWAAWNDRVWLLQSLRNAPTAAREPRPAGKPGAREHGTPVPAAALAGAGRQPVPAPALARAQSLLGFSSMPDLAAVVRARGRRVRATPAAPGVAAGRLLACRPHQRVQLSSGDAVLLIDQPLPAYAPLLFGVRGVIARTGAASAHLAEVARSLGVPMVAGCHLEDVAVSGPGSGNWLAAVNGATGDVTLLAV